MVLTSADLKRLLSLMRNRATRARGHLNKIIMTGKLKRFDHRALTKVANALQDAYGQMRVIEEGIQDVLE